MLPNDPSLRSFVDVAADSGFPIQNLPYGVFSTASDSRPRVGVAIGDYVLDLAAIEESGLIPRMSAQSVFRQPSLNALMASGGYSWSTAQQIAHHASSGCAMRIGDVIGSGTISGPGKSSYGSMLELSWGGKEPIALADGSVRTFLEDGDTVTIRGFCQGEGYRIGLGEVTGEIVPAD